MRHLRTEVSHQEVHVVFLDSIWFHAHSCLSTLRTLLAFKDHTGSLRCQIVSKGLTWRVVWLSKWALGLVAKCGQHSQLVKYGNAVTHQNRWATYTVWRQYGLSAGVEKFEMIQNPQWWWAVWCGQRRVFNLSPAVSLLSDRRLFVILISELDRTFVHLFRLFWTCCRIAN